MWKKFFKIYLEVTFLLLELDAEEVIATCSTVGLIILETSPEINKITSGLLVSGLLV